MERISKHQLFCLYMLFEIGSTTLFALGVEAKQDAWIVDLLGMVNGFGLIWLFTQLQKHFPRKNLIEIIETLVGKILGIPLALLYALYFIQSSVINFSEFNFLMEMTFLQKTPRYVIALVFMALIAYYLFLGVETVFRTGEVLFPLLLGFILFIYMLIPVSMDVHFENLEPVLGNGIGPIIKSLYPYAVVFPFGEAFVFMMFWKYVNKPEKIRKTCMSACFFSGLIITGSTILILTALGADYAGIAAIPLLDVIKKINILDVISNLGGLGVVVIFVGGFYKALINLFGGVLALSSAIRVNRKILIVPVCVFAYLVSMITIPSLTYHRYIAMRVYYGFHFIFEILIPMVLFLVYLVKSHLLKVDFQKLNEPEKKE